MKKRYTLALECDKNEWVDFCSTLVKLLYAKDLPNNPRMRFLALDGIVIDILDDLNDLKKLEEITK